MATVARLQTAADLSASQIAGAISPLMPAGVVLPYAGTSAPAGWLACDGASISRTTYPGLFAAIGTAHGTVDGVTNFNLPDYRGRFIRGGDAMFGGIAANRDPDKAGRTASNANGNTGNAVGSVQVNATAKNALAVTNNAVTSTAMSANASHSHMQQFTGLGAGGAVGWGGNSTFTTWAAGTVSGSNMNTVSSNVDHTHNITSNVTLGNGDNETRPLNAYVNYIIKI